MLSLDTAKKLGLEPRYHDGNYIYRNYRHGYKAHLVADWTMEVPCDEDLWLPRLDQILSEIERRGYSYTLERHGSKDDVRYSLLLMEWDEKVAEIDFGNGWSPLIDFYANTPEEAAAAALLWILERDADG